ncbi:MAG: hypothetical protein ABSG98_06415 [Anaerolineales bacterium]|jgi:hypothetical protein
MLRDRFLGVRMSESERQGLEQLAALLDQSPSATVRHLILAEWETQQKRLAWEVGNKLGKK